MNDPDLSNRLPIWFSRLTGAIHRWEFLNEGSLDGFPETRDGIRSLIEDGPENGETARTAPNLRLEVGVRFVSVLVEGEPTRRIWRLTTGRKSTKHHQVPRMLIRRWADKEGRVLWRRSEWEPGRVARMRPGKIMRRNDAYTIRAGMDPQIAERHLAQLESVTADTLLQIDELVEQTPEGRPARWQGQLLYAQDILKLFILHQMIRTEESRRRLEREFPLQDSIQAARSNATGWTDSDTALVEYTRRNWLAFTTSMVHPDHPWYKSAVDPATEIYIGLPNPPGDVFPLTDNPVWSPMPITSTSRPTAKAMRRDLGALAPFLPISPRVGIGIKPSVPPEDNVKWALIPVDLIAHCCRGLARRHSEVVLPCHPNRIWDVFRAR